LLKEADEKIGTQPNRSIGVGELWAGGLRKVGLATQHLQSDQHLPSDGCQAPRSLAPRPCNRLVARLEAVGNLSRDDREAIHAICRDAQAVPVHRSIIRAGEKPEHVHIVVEGWTARAETLADGTRQISAFLIPGDFCNLHAAILGEVDHDLIALTDAKVAFVPHEVMDDLARERPALRDALRWVNSVDEAVLRAWLSSIGRRDAYGRIAHLFCELHARMTLIGLVEHGCFDLPITQEMLADAQGLTPVHVNRTLQALRGDGLIELAERRLTILDMVGLQNAAGFDPTYLYLGMRARR